MKCEGHKGHFDYSWILIYAFSLTQVYLCDFLHGKIAIIFEYAFTQDDNFPKKLGDSKIN